MRNIILICVSLILTCPLIVTNRRFAVQNGANFGHFKKNKKTPKKLRNFRNEIPFGRTIDIATSIFCMI
jgi:hypothetical protein